MFQSIISSARPKFGDGADLQYDGVVEADVGERPVDYHHVRVEDFSPQLQQAEHGASVELCGDGGGECNYFCSAY